MSIPKFEDATEIAAACAHVWHSIAGFNQRIMLLICNFLGMRTQWLYLKLLLDVVAFNWALFAMQAFIIIARFGLGLSVLLNVLILAVFLSVNYVAVRCKNASVAKSPRLEDVASALANAIFVVVLYPVTVIMSYFVCSVVELQSKIPIDVGQFSGQSLVLMVVFCAMYQHRKHDLCKIAQTVWNSYKLNHAFMTNNMLFKRYTTADVQRRDVACQENTTNGQRVSTTITRRPPPHALTVVPSVITR